MIDIVCVNWNSGALLDDCVESLLAHGGGVVGEIVVVDNASSDGSADRIAGLDEVTLVRLEENQGFAAACNIGAMRAAGEFILFLNPDSRIFAGTLRESLEFMEDPANSEVGISGAKLLDAHNVTSRSCARFPKVSSIFATVFGVDRLFPGLGYMMTEWDHASTREVDHVIGAYYFVRRRLFEAVDGFDERFFVYLEDLDFSLRARRAGWRTVFLADAVAYHEGGGTSKQIKARRLFYSLRSRILYVFKHFNRPAAVAVAVVTIFIEPIARSAQAILHLSWTSLKETFMAYRLLINWCNKRLFLDHD